MHKLMHQASPTLAAGEDQRLDDAATKYMVLRAMGPSLALHARAGAARATKTIGAKRAHLEQEVRAAIAGLWSDAGVIDAVKAEVGPQLTAAGHPALVGRVDALLRHQGAGVDTGRIARTIVKQQIGAKSIETEPVTFQVEPASLRVRVQVDGQWRDGRSAPPSRFSLVAPPDGIFPAVLAPASLAPGRTARGLLAVGEQADRIRVVVEGLIEPADGADVEPDDDDLFGSAAPPLRRFRVTSPPAQRP
jgi:hypothetical protein